MTTQSIHSTLKSHAKLSIYPIKALSDNYIWAIVNNSTQEVIIVDPGEAEPVIQFIDDNKLRLKDIWITHKHFDHINGVPMLKATYPWLTIYAHQQHQVPVDYCLTDNSEFEVWGYRVQVLWVAGHSENHIAFWFAEDVEDIEDVEDVKSVTHAHHTHHVQQRRHVFCGDTIFSGGCGRVFTGDLALMYQSVMRLASLDEPEGTADKAIETSETSETPIETLLYPAHEYTASNLRFGLHIEPHNEAMQQHLTKVESMVAKGIPSLPTTLAREKQINVFLRVSQQSVIDGLADVSAERLDNKIRNNISDNTEDNKQNIDDNIDENPVAVFTALRQLKDSF